MWMYAISRRLHYLITLFTRNQLRTIPNTILLDPAALNLTFIKALRGGHLDFWIQSIMR